MADILEMAVVFSSIVAVIKIISDNIVRRRLIDKGLVDEKIKYLYAGGPQGHALANLKWGIVLIGIGAAAFLSYLFPDTIYEGGAIGLMFIFGGVGFLAYYFLLSNKLKEEEKRSND